MRLTVKHLELVKLCPKSTGLPTWQESIRIRDGIVEATDGAMYVSLPIESSVSERKKFPESFCIGREAALRIARTLKITGKQGGQYPVAVVKNVTKDKIEIEFPESGSMTINREPKHEGWPAAKLFKDFEKSCLYDNKTLVTIDCGRIKKLDDLLLARDGSSYNEVPVLGHPITLFIGEPGGKIMIQSENGQKAFLMPIYEKPVGEEDAEDSSEPDANAVGDDGEAENTGEKPSAEAENQPVGETTT